jgi:hypothetical protein
MSLDPQVLFDGILAMAECDSLLANGDRVPEARRVAAEIAEAAIHDLMKDAKSGDVLEYQIVNEKVGGGPHPMLTTHTRVMRMMRGDMVLAYLLVREHPLARIVKLCFGQPRLDVHHPDRQDATTGTQAGRVISPKAVPAVKVSRRKRIPLAVDAARHQHISELMAGPNGMELPQAITATVRRFPPGAADNHILDTSLKKRLERDHPSDT